MPEEFAWLGQEKRTRGKRLDEQIEVIRKLFEKPEQTAAIREAARRLYLRQFSYAAARSNDPYREGSTPSMQPRCAATFPTSAPVTPSGCT